MTSIVEIAKANGGRVVSAKEMDPGTWSRASRDEHNAEMAAEARAER